MPKRKQRYWTPRSPEDLIDSILEQLKAKWKFKSESDVITKLVIDAENNYD